MGVKPVKKGEIIELTIDDVAYGGDAVGRVEGFAIFVPGGLPGERVLAQIKEVKNSFARAEFLKVKEGSKNRQEAKCFVYEECGGCQLQHANYEAQLAYKKSMVEDALERIGGIEVEVNSPIGMEYPYFYRNKAQFPVDKQDDEVVIGFYAAGSHEIIDTNNCKIQHPLINRVARKAKEAIKKYELSVYNEKEHTGLVRHLVVRVGVCTNQAMLVLVTKDKAVTHKKELADKLIEEIPELVSVYQNINPEKTNVVFGKETEKLAGEDYIIDYIGRVKYQISPRSFFQVNTLQAEELYEQVLKYADLSKEEVVIDAYCGLGSISLYLASKAKEIFGIEVIEEAVKMARKNAKLNRIENCLFKVGKVEELLPKMSANVDPDVVVVDPPRKGCSKEVLAAFTELDPKRIVYVSCDPTSLARDLDRLEELGYKTREVQPVDMFSQTYHIENVAWLEKVISC